VASVLSVMESIPSTSPSTAAAFNMGREDLHSGGGTAWRGDRQRGKGATRSACDLARTVRSKGAQRGERVADAQSRPVGSARE